MPRGDANTHTRYGKLREPARFLAGVRRGVGGTSDGVYLRNRSAVTSENVYQAPSVFNLYWSASSRSAATMATT